MKLHTPTANAALNLLLADGQDVYLVPSGQSAPFQDEVGSVTHRCPEPPFLEPQGLGADFRTGTWAGEMA